MRGRWRVACCNWGVADPTAPRAISYLLVDGAAELVAYAPTWREALERANIMAQGYPWMAVRRL